MRLSAAFTTLAKWTSRAAGAPAAFSVALAIVLLWLASGSFFRFSDSWQLVINTGTTIATFLMVFLIQNTQNRESTALHIKLDELIRAVEGAHNARYEELARTAREELRKGRRDTGRPEVRPQA